jgi:hypothetical protein
MTVSDYRSCRREEMGGYFQLPASLGKGPVYPRFTPVTDYDVATEWSHETAQRLEGERRVSLKFSAI